jgi:hypothetical protein
VKLTRSPSNRGRPSAAARFPLMDGGGCLEVGTLHALTLVAPIRQTGRKGNEMRRYQCSRCSKRVNRGAVRCVSCGGEPSPAAAGIDRRTKSIAMSLIGLGLILAVTFSDRYVPAVSDWYTRAVINYVPADALWLASPSDDDRAFYLCARSVVREIDDERSVVTFAGLSLGQTRELDDGRLQVESYVDEALEGGPTYRRTFSCILREEGGEWRVEAVNVEQPAPTAVAVTSVR